MWIWTNLVTSADRITLRAGPQTLPVPDWLFLREAALQTVSEPIMRVFPAIRLQSSVLWVMVKLQSVPAVQMKLANCLSLSHSHLRTPWSCQLYGCACLCTMWGSEIPWWQPKDTQEWPNTTPLCPLVAFFTITNWFYALFFEQPCVFWFT